MGEARRKKLAELKKLEAIKKRFLPKPSTRDDAVDAMSKWFADRVDIMLFNVLTGRHEQETWCTEGETADAPSAEVPEAGRSFTLAIDQHRGR